MDAVKEFGASLESKAGQVSTVEAFAGKKLVGIYFSAHWCPPCRGFTPVLAEFYEACKEADESGLEIVFSSLDNDASEYKEYCGEMPWLCLPFGSAASEALKNKHKFRGIPHFIIVNVATGEVVDGDARSTVMGVKGNVAKAFAQWLA